MKGVILAAGNGTRLLSHTCERPKPLVNVGGRTLIDFTLDALAQAGVTDLAIIIGYKGDAIRQWIGDGSDRGLRIQYLFNPEFTRGNALSLHAARSFVGEELFLLSMADHMVSVELLWWLLEGEYADNTLAVDFAPSPQQVEEATKVLVSEDRRVVSIGKRIPQWSGVDAGVFLFTPAIFDAIASMREEDQAEYQLSQAVTWLMAAGHPLLACDISGCFWYDVDTPEDLRSATRLIEESERWRQLLRA